MPDLVPDDQFALLVDGRLLLTKLGIFLTQIPHQYCLEEVLDGGESFFNLLDAIKAIIRISINLLKNPNYNIFYFSGNRSLVVVICLTTGMHEANQVIFSYLF
jgi:hypothetical protein